MRRWQPKAAAPLHSAQAVPVGLPATQVVRSRPEQLVGSNSRPHPRFTFDRLAELNHHRSSGRGSWTVVGDDDVYVNIA